MFNQTFWQDRKEAAEKLVERLKADRIDFNLVLALPRGGVILGVVVAQTFNKPLDLLIPRKIGAPMNPEYAIGAVTEEGLAVWNEAEKLAVDEKWLEKEVEKERTEARRRRETYLKGGQRHSLKNKTVLIVDDGIATGLTMLAAIAEAKLFQAEKILVAVPVAPPDSIEKVSKEVDQIIVLEAPDFLGSVGQYYKKFDQVSDQEVVKLMNL